MSKPINDPSIPIATDLTRDIKLIGYDADADPDEDALVNLSDVLVYTNNAVFYSLYDKGQVDINPATFPPVESSVVNLSDWFPLVSNTAYMYLPGIAGKLLHAYFSRQFAPYAGFPNHTSVPKLEIIFATNYVGGSAGGWTSDMINTEISGQSIIPGELGLWGNGGVTKVVPIIQLPTALTDRAIPFARWKLKQVGTNPLDSVENSSKLLTINQHLFEMARFYKNIEV